MNDSEFGNFLRLLTHDLQNQLGAIDLNLQIVPTLAPEDDATMKAFAPFLGRAGLASADMIDTLQDVQAFARSVSRIDDSGVVHEVTMTKCDLTSKVRECAMILAGAAKDREVTLLTSLIDDVSALGETDTIRRSIRILASEALRASFPGSVVELKVFKTPVPTVEIATSQEGVFDEHRPLLSMYLVRQLLEATKTTMLFVSSVNRSAVQLLFLRA
jgi:signal transduction histidine kinase